MFIPFNKSFLVGTELEYIKEAINNNHISGDGIFTKRCQKWLEGATSCKKALLTHSCTAALEMAALLADVKPRDEIIMPSYTFVSTANAFVLRGGVPVFVDIRSDTLNIDETLIEGVITKKTKAIVPVHYAGVACEMETIMKIADQYRLLVVEDAAQGIMCTYNGKPLGSLGHLGALSFHETKNITSGEGGAILINDARFIERAEIIREKGTNRSKFFRGEVDKYSWTDIGSSYLPNDITAAFLYAQMKAADQITAKRMFIWQKYYACLKPLAEKGKIQLPFIPDNCTHNAHMFYIVTRGLEERTSLMQHMKEKEINSIFHYVPLHSSSAGRRYGRVGKAMTVTDNLSDRLLRLPIYCEMREEDVERVVETIFNFYHYKKSIMLNSIKVK